MSTSEDDDLYRGGTGSVFVEGCKLGGRAKRIFLDVVKEDMMLVGTGGKMEAADWPWPLPQGTASWKGRKCSSVFQRCSSTSHLLLSRMSNSNWSCWRSAWKHATRFVCVRVAISVCVSAWIIVHTACVNLAGTPSHMTDCLGVHQSGPAGCLGAGLNDQPTPAITFISTSL